MGSLDMAGVVRVVERMVRIARMVSMEVLVAVVSRVLRSFWQDEWICVERYRFDHVDAQQVVQRLLVKHLFLHHVGYFFELVLVRLVRTKQVLPRNLNALIKKRESVAE